MKTREVIKKAADEDAPSIGWDARLTSTSRPPMTHEAAFGTALKIAASMPAESTSRAYKTYRLMGGLGGAGNSRLEGFCPLQDPLSKWRREPGWMGSLLPIQSRSLSGFE